MAKLEQEAHRKAALALSQQQETLTELRARTGTLLTAASLVASFLGGQALTRHGLSIWVIAALVAFGVSVVLSIYVLLPKTGPAPSRSLDLRCWSRSRFWRLGWL